MDTTTTTRFESADRDDDTTNAPTLAQLIAARAEQRAEHERENARRAQLSRENDRRAVIEYALTWMGAHVSPELATALRMLPACDDNHIDDEDSDFTTAALILLDVTGADVDPDARPDDRDDGRWHIARRPTSYHGWQLRGPHGYKANLGDVYQDTLQIDAHIIDALAAYPAWLAGAEERRREEEKKRQREQRAKPRRYVYVEGIHQDDKHPGVLTRGNRLCVRVQNPRADDGLIAYTGTLDNFSVGWLLITTESGAQRLIPVDRVQDITPLADLSPDLDTDPDDAA